MYTCHRCIICVDLFPPSFFIQNVMLLSLNDRDIVSEENFGRVMISSVNDHGQERY